MEEDTPVEPVAPVVEEQIVTENLGEWRTKHERKVTDLTNRCEYLETKVSELESQIATNNCAPSSEEPTQELVVVEKEDAPDETPEEYRKEPRRTRFF